MATRDEVLRAMADSDDDQIGIERIRQMLRAADALGWRMVPKEASTEMFQAFVDGEWFEQKPRPREIWDAMLSASPSLIEE